MTSLAPRPTAESIREQVIDWRRHLHRHPELSFEEEQTSRFIADRLAEFDGLDVERPTATSVVARLVSGRPGPVLAIRADIDALPIVEKNDHDFVSTAPGVMHACGHDGHTAMLLGAAAILAARRDGDLCDPGRSILDLADAGDVETEATQLGSGECPRGIRTHPGDEIDGHSAPGDGDSLVGALAPERDDVSRARDGFTRRGKVVDIARGIDVERSEHEHAPRHRALGSSAAG